MTVWRGRTAVETIGLSMGTTEGRGAHRWTKGYKWNGYARPFLAPIRAQMKESGNG